MLIGFVYIHGLKVWLLLVNFTNLILENYLGKFLFNWLALASFHYFDSHLISEWVSERIYGLYIFESFYI